MTQQPLTKRQHEVLVFVADSIKANGYAPTLEEIGERFSLRSLATVYGHLENLRSKGYIRRQWNRSRSIKLITSPGCCPTCGREFEKAKVSVENERKVCKDQAAGEGSAIPTPT